MLESTTDGEGRDRGQRSGVGKGWRSRTSEVRMWGNMREEERGRGRKGLLFMTLDEIQDKVLTNEYDYTLHAEAVTMEDKMRNFCGSTEYDKRRTDYLYLYRGNYLVLTL